MIHYEQSRRLTDIAMAKNLLDSLENYYPGFQYWFTNKCVPGILLGPDVLIVAKEHDQVVGVVLGKKRDAEIKLRCIRVVPSHQNRGTGLHLIDRMLRALDEAKPHCTVSEEMLHLYSRAFINHYQFGLAHVDKGLYRPGKLEYVFNTTPSHIIH
ncbi:MAG: GNAT family N-acetyltransferase [Agitococcus sp.]|nr:GNAT family N-acetyltransferase [Agitococcus sp.]MDO9177639.1 GNAT family N-acetyltransferase [Agitococcus sp.]